VHSARRRPSRPGPVRLRFAARVNELLADPKRAEHMGKAGRVRAVGEFSWGAIAEKTIGLYERLIAANRAA
jgi:starch synthase